MIGLQLRMKDLSPDSLAQLEKDGIKFKQSKNMTYIQLSEKDDGKFIFPDLFKGYENNLSINISESGRLKGDVGQSSVVCGFYGARLRPYYISAGKIDDNHALFSLRVATVVSCTYPDLLMKIMRYKIEVSEGIAEIVSEEVFKGTLEKLRQVNYVFVPAAEAAIEIASTRNCCDAHFIAEPSYA